MVNFHICPGWVSLFPRQCWLLQLLQRQWPHLCRSHLAVRCCGMQVTMSNRSGNHANQYPAGNYWNESLVVRSCAFSNGYIINYWCATSYHLKSHVACSGDRSIIQVIAISIYHIISVMPMCQHAAAVTLIGSQSRAFVRMFWVISTIY